MTKPSADLDLAWGLGPGAWALVETRDWAAGLRWFVSMQQQASPRYARLNQSPFWRRNGDAECKWLGVGGVKVGGVKVGGVEVGGVRFRFAAIALVGRGLDSWRAAGKPGPGKSRLALNQKVCASAARKSGASGES